MTKEIHWCEIHCEQGPSLRIFHDGILGKLLHQQVTDHLKRTFEKVHTRDYTSKVPDDWEQKYHIWRIGDNVRDLLYHVDQDLSLAVDSDYTLTKEIQNDAFWKKL